MPEDNCKAVADGFGVPYSQSRLTRALLPHKHVFIPNVYTLEALNQISTMLGVPSANWDAVKQDIQNHHIPKRPSQSASAHAHPVINLDSDGSEGDDQGGGGHLGAAPAPGVAPGVAAVVVPGVAVPAGVADPTVAGLKRELSATKLKLRNMRFNRHYWRNTAKEAKKSLAKLQVEHDTLQRGGKRKPLSNRKAPRFFTPVGGLAMAIRCNLCHTPAACMGFVLMVDVHRDSVTKYEIVLDACLRRACAKWYERKEKELHSKGGFVIHATRSDATNARIWHRQKLHVFEGDSVYRFRGAGEDGHDVGEGGDGEQVEQVDNDESVYLGDLCVVQAGTGKACRSMLLKQTASIGMPTWQDNVKKLYVPYTGPPEAAPQTFLEELQRQRAAADPNRRSVAVHLQTTDAGTDQTGSRNMISREVAHVLFILHLTANCRNHQVHISYRGNLLFSEWCLRYLGIAFGFFSTECKVVNIWREYGKALYTVCLAMYGPEMADDFFRKCPPRCLIGRWGAEWAACRHVLAPPLGVLIAVFKAVLEKQKPSRRRPGAETELQSDDEGREEHQVRFGKWGKACLQGLQTKEWIQVMKISHRAKVPLQHLLFAIEKHSKRLIGTQALRHEQVHFIALLVWGKATEIANEFNAMTNLNCWNDVLTQAELAEPKVHNVMFVHLFHGAAEYDLRIKKPTLQWPARMLLMVKQPAGTYCEIRKTVASEVLGADVHYLEINTLKIRTIFQGELERARDTGKLDESLFQLLWWIARKWRADTQEVEGINSCLKMLIARAPNIQLALASARLAIRKALRIIGVTGSRTCKWSVLAPVVDALLKTALPYYGDTDDIFAREDRFAPMFIHPVPAPISFAGMQLEDGPTRQLDGPAFRWACKVNKRWADAHLKTGKDDRGYTLLTVVCFSMVFKAGVRCYVCCTSLRNVGMFLQCEFTSNCDIDVRRPPTFHYSVDVFQDLYPRVAATEAIPVVAATVDWKFNATFRLIDAFVYAWLLF